MNDVEKREHKAHEAQLYVPKLISAHHLYCYLGRLMVVPLNLV